MKEDLLKIINHYGVMPQLKYLQSEVFELNEAIIEYESFNDYAPIEASSIEVNGKAFTMPKYAKKLREHIEEEFADVMVLLSQFKYYYNLDNEKIKEIMQQKIERQLERMEKGE